MDELVIKFDYILKTPNLVSAIGAFNEAERLSPKTFLVSTGSMMPSSQILEKKMVNKMSQFSKLMNRNTNQDGLEVANLAEEK